MVPLELESVMIKRWVLIMFEILESYEAKSDSIYMYYYIQA